MKKRKGEMKRRRDEEKEVKRLCEEDRREEEMKIRRDDEMKR